MPVPSVWCSAMSVFSVWHKYHFIVFLLVTYHVSRLTTEIRIGDHTDILAEVFLLSSLVAGEFRDNTFRQTTTTSSSIPSSSPLMTILIFFRC